MAKEFSRACSFDPSFEQLLPYALHWNTIVEEEDFRESPIDRAQFEKFFDQDGRIADEQRFRKSVFRGGVSPEVRKEAWKFLYGYYPFQSTKREREASDVEFHYRYEALKARWKSVLGSWSEEREQEEEMKQPSPNTTKQIHSPSQNGCLELTEHISTVVKLGEDLSLPNNLHDDLHRYKFFEIQAKIYANRQPIEENLKGLKKTLRIIDKDVPRTDRDLPFFSGKNNQNLEKLRDILVTFAVFHPDVTYAQGMNDILSRFLVVLNNEVEAYWCFTNYLEKITNEFLEHGMLKKLESVQKLLQEIDPFLSQHLAICDVGDLMFCHRWLLLSFKREFVFEECIELFEIISSQHLELTSDEAERLREVERAKDFLREGGRQRLAVADINTEFTFELFICVAILHHHREDIKKCNDSASVFQFINGLTHKLDLKQVLTQAEGLVREYCRKSVISNSFEMVE
ncbi:putative TBC1 domain family member 17 [Apostichopus japonicus]|uniref:Putative TBC1 domain family member 17 n=1 Tax=Stichopus japonicus TaxID=307972 RepID=A0A2G8LLR8_STIJA|nr:putative TBC1 domain family member 17 [Apostichopus japonicus]